MPSHPTSIRFNRILLTGAAGGLGRELRTRLKAYCTTLRLSDIADLGDAQPAEELHPAKLEDAAAVHALLQDVDTVVHLGGVSTEQPWEPILQANIIGAYNLYEAARKQGVKRIVFASSNHVTGFYRQDEVVGLKDPPALTASMACPRPLVKTCRAFTLTATASRPCACALARPS